MGRRGRGGNRGGGRGGRGRGRGSSRGRDYRSGPANYTELEKKNENFENYYNALGIVEEEEREQFWTALKRELPNSFRFTGSKGHALSVQQRLIDRYIPQITSVTYEGQPVPPPTPLEWFPEKLAWSMTTPKQVVRKFPPFASFQKFLVSETSVGNISRQEVVSMIPPLLMDIKPGMTVLDLCAAPGSKSAQLIEMVHGGEEARVRQVLHNLNEQQGRGMSPDGMEIEAEKAQAQSEDDWSDDGRATGLLIANDVDYRRAQMLVHQVKRLNSPNMIVTNHDATLFPSIKLYSEPDQPGRYLKFDRILADVPCSGDGTARKNPNIWKDWIPGNGLGLYATQVRILVRALQMLKVGGRVVYSTCSMNPVEDEAVVASAIDRCGGVSKVKIIDCSDTLPGLKRKSGLSEWKIMDKTGRMWSSWKEVEEAREAQGEEGFGRLTEGMFPPVTESEDERLALERCIRVYPHLQDTGGFFIAVLEKQTEIKARPESRSKITAPKPPVASLLDALNAKIENPTNGDVDRNLHEAYENLAPMRVDPDNALDDSNAPPTARQNRANTPPATKRPLEDDEEDGGVSQDSPTKRVKTDVDDSRMVHFPPPPAAQLEPEKYEDTADEPLELDTINGGQEPYQPPSRPDQPPKKRRDQPHEEPFKYLDPDHEELLGIYKFYEVSPRFPRDRFMVRNATGQPVKAIYYTSTLAREILTQNEGKGMKFVHCGVKMFMKQDAQGQDVCRWRIQSEGMPIIEPWVGEGRIVRLYKRETLRKLLIEMFPRVAQDGWRDLGEIGERVRDIGMGCCVLRVETSDDEDGFKERLVLPLWRSISSLNLMLPKEDRKAMLLRLYNDDSPLVDNSKNRFKQQETSRDISRSSTAGTPLPESGIAEATDEPETIIDKDGGVVFNTAMDSDVEETTTGIGGKGIGPEHKAMEAEDRMKADAQNKADNTREIAPGVTDEEDVFNKGV
ncbi:hypothetical protein W97_08685 [Coniosporium apollinis CBS 100218]|uniref:SAM-dependent MTase RsmB/NOP-type domain-containing protein n=1 Tax=Coniosporium apollinis (strain CBS 100218) TaxID=1168221 RepID=R7Z5F6_CONA1|nr:uncharacterized protein W97_08685 [Coniosporium apollinis CBS 100218]EON69425.1 hypothetical protein W97_08685 [Coniosporium apollinis CBS 100218]